MAPCASEAAPALQQGRRSAAVSSRRLPIFPAAACSPGKASSQLLPKVFSCHPSATRAVPSTRPQAPRRQQRPSCPSSASLRHSRPDALTAVSRACPQTGLGRKVGCCRPHGPLRAVSVRTCCSSVASLGALSPPVSRVSAGNHPPVTSPVATTCHLRSSTKH